MKIYDFLTRGASKKKKPLVSGTVNQSGGTYRFFINRTAADPKTGGTTITVPVDTYGNFEWDNEQGYVINSLAGMFYETTSSKRILKSIEFGEKAKKIGPVRADYMFYYQTRLTIVNVDNLVMSNTKNFLYGDTALISIDVSNVNASHITDASSMFNGCTYLKSIIGFENLDTSSMTNMSNMFKNCYKLSDINVSNLNLEKTSNVNGLFYQCEAITSLDVSKWDTSSITDMGNLFYDCRELLYLDVSKWNTSNVKIMSGVFSKCSKITSPDVSGWDTSNATSMAELFRECPKITSLDVSNFDTSNVTSMYYLFGGCSGLTSIDVSNFVTSNVTNMGRMFSGLKVGSINVLNLDTSKVTNMAGMFTNCSNLTTLDVSNFVTSNVTNASIMFSGCSRLTTLDVSNFDTSKLSIAGDTSYGGMFSYCTNLEELNLSNWDTSSLTNTVHMFDSSKKLKIENIIGFDDLSFENVVNAQDMFRHMELTSIYFKTGSFDKATNISGMLANNNFESLDLSNLTFSKVTATEGFLQECVNLKYVDLSGFESPDLTIIGSGGAMYGGMFRGSTKLERIKLDNFNTLKVTNWTSFVPNVSTLTIDYRSSKWKPNIPAAFPLVNWNDLDNQPLLKGTVDQSGGTYTFYVNRSGSSPSTGGTAVTVPVDATGNWKWSNTEGLEITSLAGAFYAASATAENAILSSIEFSEGVKDLGAVRTDYMFRNQANLTSVEGLSNLVSSNTPGMFNSCESLETVDLTGFDTSNVSNMSSMFHNCSSLTSIEGLSDLDTSNVTNISSMFNGSAINDLDLSNWNTTAVTTYSNFIDDSSSKTVTYDSSKWNSAIPAAFPNVNWNDIFVQKIVGTATAGTTEIELNVNDAVVTVPVNDDGSFSYTVPNQLTNLRMLITPDGNTPSNVTSIDVSSIDTSNVTNMNAVFGLGTNLQSITGLEKFNTSKVVDMAYMFAITDNIDKIDISSFDTSSVSNMMAMFGNCGASEIKFGDRFVINSGTNTTDMFLTEDFATNLTTITDLPANCINESIDISALTSLDQDSVVMFVNALGTNGTDKTFTMTPTQYNMALIGSVSSLNTAVQNGWTIVHN